ncbi:uncharacterized protein ASCRUDRAFT_76852 [Ascoidea rubescens DSM 1968]|uniref:Uncharacterized protein n=1 Tax=Ascoidea rubescens DSM 1968 TaxID=1344418 RepID=A0A1D2VEC1_9ASCO|nr:hypothetical protein ASCRUDRAFT_76852 [Ascoidea rubescens DSM 1968]ODV59932.1 hypothetical protein ASCRUDRAFT_76852 [Ascoidea rubescens DSM 1968]
MSYSTEPERVNRFLRDTQSQNSNIQNDYLYYYLMKNNNTSTTTSNNPYESNRSREPSPILSNTRKAAFYF